MPNSVSKDISPTCFQLNLKPPKFKTISLPLLSYFGVGTVKFISFKRLFDASCYLSLKAFPVSYTHLFLFKASIFQSGKGAPEPFSMAVTGDITEIDPGSFESGKEMEVSVKLAVHFLDINIGKVPVALLDVENMICLIGGVDYLAQVLSLIHI